MAGSTTKHIAQLYIEWTDGDIDGSYKHLDTEYMDNLLSVEVDDSLYLPDMFSIHILDPGIQALRQDIFKLGRKIKISVQTEGSTSRVLLMKGEITCVEPDLNSTSRSTLLARGYDLSHRLHRTRRTQTYLNMTDSDIVEKLAQGANLLPKVKHTSQAYDYLIQANQTDWEFLAQRAQRIGYKLFVEGKTLYFEPPPTAPPVDTKLDWGINLDTFRARLSTVDQVAEVVVRGYDPKAKAAIIGYASQPSGLLPHRKDNGSTGGEAAQKAHAIGGKEVIVDRPVTSQAEADKLAQSALDRRAAGFVQAEGHCQGDPGIRAGTSVNISGVGPRFGDKYLVTRALHRYRSQGYNTSFWVSGGNGTATISDLLQGSNGASHGTRPSVAAGGVMVGLVTNNNDPQNQGRVKVKFPALGESIESYWCHIAAPMAGPKQGVAYFPEANDQVVVAFEHGDPNYGYILGAVWNGADSPPVSMLGTKLVNGSKTLRRVIKSRRQHEITVDDEPGPTEGILLVDRTQKNLFRIITQDNKIKIEADGDIEITSALGDIKITSSTGSVSINGLKGVDIGAGAGKIAAKGTTGVDITATAQVNIKGIIINLN